MLKDTITVDQLSLVISQAAAPAFLLGAVASFLGSRHAHEPHSRPIASNQRHFG